MRVERKDISSNMAKNLRLRHQKKGLGSKSIVMDISITQGSLRRLKVIKKNSLVCVGQTR